MDEDRQQTEAFIDAQIKLISAAYDKAIAYTNLIILAGYAGFFGLWQLTKDHLSKPEILWSAILMLTSVLVFVLFEVWKMYHSSHSLLGLAEIFQNPENKKSIAKLLGEIEAHNVAQRNRTIRLGRVWHVVLVITVFTGLCAVGILAWAFVKALTC